MAYDVVVVGGGIGGLTVAALLSARGVNTCLLERQSLVGGCIARVEFSGHEFEPGMGVYTSFGEGEIYDRVFAELPVEVPKTSLLSRPYVVRLDDGTNVQLLGDDFSDELSGRFPECTDAATEFYRSFALEDLHATSQRFRSFIDTQVRAFLHNSVDQCSPAAISTALNRVRGPLYEIDGGPATLATRLAESIKRSGGTVRLDTPVLRLAYDEAGRATGVDLLSGEQVIANKAIVSNLTIWDTYGKLVGLNRTPPEIKKQLNALQGTGAYIVYATIEEPALARLPSERLLATLQAANEPDDLFSEVTFATHGRTATLKSVTDVDHWFTYHASEEDFEESDQAALEQFWTKLHAALPELGGDIEIIETANPRTFYEQTRRKLGMVMGVQGPQTPLAVQSPGRQSGFQSYAPLNSRQIQILSPTAVLPNLYVVGDTVTPSPNLESIIETASSLADHVKTKR
ncbi:MAG TPA: FAD-dependent oxidoreductase [Pyrinomonadaceae bacterium]|nr:FAD-dependent oxidoreductase [Pyrinomonadaceae bacterium]